jgi:hypothetical protein
MYIIGVATLLVSLVVKHWASRTHAAHPVEATAH